MPANKTSVGSHIDLYCEVIEEYPSTKGQPKFILIKSLDKSSEGEMSQLFSDQQHKFCGQTLKVGDKFGAVGEVTADNQGTLVLCLSKFKKMYGQEPAKGKVYKKDNSGMETGHALNAAFFWGASPAQLCEKAKQMHSSTVKVKERYAEHMDKPATDYGIGAATGNAIHLACRYKQGGAQEVVENTAWAILTKIVPDVTEFVKENC